MKTPRPRPPLKPAIGRRSSPAILRVQRKLLPRQRPQEKKSPSLSEGALATRVALVDAGAAQSAAAAGVAPLAGLRRGKPRVVASGSKTDGLQLDPPTVGKS